MSPATTLYNHIGTSYNSTRTADPYLLSRLCALLQPTPQGHYLDIGCGTGNYTSALAQTGLRFTGIDPSEVMLAEARQKSEQVQWLRGTAEQIPAADATFDGAIATLTVHHWHHLQQAFEELHRVLKPHCRLVIFTSTPEQMQGYWLCHYFPRMMQASMKVMPALEAITEAAAAAGFAPEQAEEYHVQASLKDCFLYIGKHDPGRYFDPVIRAGISSFAALAHKAEIEQGLQQLRHDLASGAFAQVQAKYSSGSGDYLFVRMVKE